jgi:hypothetical protein
MVYAPVPKHRKYHKHSTISGIHSPKVRKMLKRWNDTVKHKY